jgi:UDP-N-acetylmuramate: L-alanyl-gamma-D-glutamyl-meso-diaminopimelate ligase
VENATGATAIALRLGLSAKEIEHGLATFAGVRRRQEVVVDAGGVVLVDDFAHHPTAVTETIAAIAARFPGRRMWALFEPRSNTASRAIHQDAYAKAFSGATEIVIATPKKIDGLAQGDVLDVVALVRALGRNARTFASVDEIAQTVLSEIRPGDVVLAMSNGAFGGLVGKLKAGIQRHG